MLVEDLAQERRASAISQLRPQAYCQVTCCGVSWAEPGSRASKSDLDLRQAGLKLSLTGEAQATGQPRPVAKGYRQPAVLDRECQVDHIGGPFFVDPPLSFHRDAQIFQSHV
jgi:hypothetical protein